MPPPSWMRFLNVRRPRPENRRGLALLALGCLTLGLLGGWLLPRPSEPAVTGRRERVGEASASHPLTASDQEEMDAAFAARQAGKLAEAKRLFTALTKKRSPLSAAEFEVGLTQIYEADFSGARATLDAAADKGIMPADANLFIGVTYTAQKAYDKAETSFATAVALDPTRPDAYFFWGECLRDQGKPLQAIGKFRAALLRNQFETAAGLYRLKLWLSEIEAGQDTRDGTREDIAAALAQPRPPMEASFAAAADALRANDLAAATGHVLRARRHADPAVFHVIMNDPLFASVHWGPELAPPPPQGRDASPRRP